MNKYKKPNLGPSPQRGANQTGRWQWHFKRIFKLRKIK